MTEAQFQREVNADIARMVREGEREAEDEDDSALAMAGREEFDIATAAMQCHQW